MKLESDWLFKQIILMFSYILVVSTGYILSISICPMFKAGKLPSTASSAILAKCYLKISLRVQKYGDFLVNCTKIPFIAFCSKSQQSPLWVDFKVESVLQSRRKQILKRNGSSYSSLWITQIQRGTRQLLGWKANFFKAMIVRVVKCDFL